MARRAFWTAVVLLAAVLAVAAAVLPERVPLHFDAGLDADRYGGRGEFLAVTGGLVAGCAVLFPALVRLVQRIPLRHVDVPHAGYWKRPERESELRRRLAEDVWTVGAGTALLLAGVCALVTSAAVDGADRLSGWAAVLLIAYLAGLAGWAVWLAARRYRPPGGRTR